MFLAVSSFYIKLGCLSGKIFYLRVVSLACFSSYTVKALAFSDCAIVQNHQTWLLCLLLLTVPPIVSPMFLIPSPMALPPVLAAPPTADPTPVAPPPMMALVPSNVKTIISQS